MAQSKSVTISVKVPIKWDGMTKISRQRLKQIVGRDTRVIRAFLGVIEQHENDLLIGRNSDRIDDGKVDRLTMTATRITRTTKQRLTVPHDFKARFRRISQNELMECRKTAVAMYESYLKLRSKKGWKPSRPCEVNQSRRIPRWVFTRRFRLTENPTSVSRWWLDLLNSLDSNPQGRRIHDRLLIPLKVSPFHLTQLERGEVKALQIFTDRMKKWWVTLAVRLDTPKETHTGLPPAVLGIDLGIEKAACTTLVTPEKVRETRYFVQKDKVQNITKYDWQVASLQHEMSVRRNSEQKNCKVIQKLKTLRTKRENLAKEYDRVLVRQILDYILELSEKYTLYVSVGRLSNIRNAARRSKSRRFRALVHSWAFSRITESLQHQLAQIGWSMKFKESRFRVVPESWTSIMCWKCGRKGIRPKQNLFVCPTCGNRCNADKNGAINIAGRLITLTESLHSVRGLGKWANAVSRSRNSRPNAQRGLMPRGKSLLSKKDEVSHPGESTAIHCVQADLLGFGDETESSDYDHAAARTVEKLSVAGSNTPAIEQEKKAKSVGGIRFR